MRHEADVTAFLQGAMFVAVGLIYLVAMTVGYDVDPLWVLPALLLGVGLAYLVGAVLRRRGR